MSITQISNYQWVLLRYQIASEYQSDIKLQASITRIANTKWIFLRYQISSEYHSDIKYNKWDNSYTCNKSCIFLCIAFQIATGPTPVPGVKSSALAGQATIPETPTVKCPSPPPPEHTSHSISTLSTSSPTLPVDMTIWRWTNYHICRSNFGIIYSQMSHERIGNKGSLC